MVVSPAFPQQITGKHRLDITLKYNAKVSSLGSVSALVVVVDLIEEAAALGLEWPVMDARRPAGISRRIE
jgi:hypothetical protein